MNSLLYLRQNAMFAPLVYILLTTCMIFYSIIPPATSNPVIKYLRENFAYILLVTIVIIGSILYFDMSGIDMNPVEDTAINKVVTVESFENDLHKRIKNGFCEHHKGGSNENLEKDCNTFTEDNCKAAGCCVWAKTDTDNKCVAGNKNGPIYKTDDNGNKIDIEAYYYKNKCYGNCK